MKKTALFVALLGILVLIGLYWFMPAKEINELGEMDSMIDNTKVIVSGMVVNERDIGRQKLMILDSGFELVCAGCDSYAGENISVLGLVGEYDGKKQIEVLRVRVLDNG